MSVAKPRCARGPDCYHVRKLASEKPPTVERDGALCGKCERAEPEPDLVLEAHKGLLRAARALLKHGVADEDIIIPTLVFAAVSDDATGFAKVRPRFAEAGDDDEAWQERRQVWHEAFADLWVERPLLDGVLVVHLKNLSVQPYPAEPGSEVVGRIRIQVYRRRNTPKDLEHLYGQCLVENGIPHDDQRGSVGWMFSEGRLWLLVHPENERVHPLGELRGGTRNERLPQRPFPSPGVVRGVYEALSPRLPKDVLVDRKRGGQPKPRVLIPACVAWYISGRGEELERSGERPKLTEALNNTLMRPSGLEPLPQSPEDHAVWQRAISPNFTDYVRRIESTLNMRGGLLGKYL
jgi:hypothetical protein